MYDASKTSSCSDPTTLVSTKIGSSLCTMGPNGHYRYSSVINIRGYLSMNEWECSDSRCHPWNCWIVDSGGNVKSSSSSCTVSKVGFMKWGFSITSYTPPKNFLLEYHYVDDGKFKIEIPRLHFQECNGIEPIQAPYRVSGKPVENCASNIQENKCIFTGRDWIENHCVFISADFDVNYDLGKLGAVMSKAYPFGYL